MSSNTRMRTRLGLNVEIQQIRNALSLVNPSDRLHVIAEALMDLREGEINYQSCGCYDWDIMMDYRNAEERS